MHTAVANIFSPTTYMKLFSTRNYAYGQNDRWEARSKTMAWSLAEIRRSRTVDEIDVHRVRVRVVGIFVEALRERFQAAALCLEVRRVLIARTREANVAGWREAERVQVALIIQEEEGEPVAARHILANVGPVVKAHRPQAFSSVTDS